MRPNRRRIRARASSLGIGGSTLTRKMLVEDYNHFQWKGRCLWDTHWTKNVLVLRTSP